MRRPVDEQLVPVDVAVPLARQPLDVVPLIPERVDQHVPRRGLRKVRVVLAEAAGAAALRVRDHAVGATCGASIEQALLDFEVVAQEAATGVVAAQHLGGGQYDTRLLLGSGWWPRLLLVTGWWSRLLLAAGCWWCG